MRGSALIALLLAGLLAADHAPARTERDRSQVRAFRAENPCPATGLNRHACPGWHVDHVIALCAGGADRPWNMQWITREDHRFKTLVDVRECRKARSYGKRGYSPPRTATSEDHLKP